MTGTFFIFILCSVYVRGQRGSISTGSTTGTTDADGNSVASNKPLQSWANAVPQNVKEYQKVLKGEDGNHCTRTKVIIDLKDGNKVKSERRIKRAIVKAIANSYDKNIPTFDAAEESAEAVLNVYASSIGSVKVEVESGNSGCWGIGFGRATARALAEGTATAMSSAVSKAAGKKAKVEFEAAAEDTATNVSEVVDNVVVLVGVGNGTTASVFRQVKVEAKVNVMACALARAFAAAKGEDVNGVAAAFTGCKEASLPATPKSDERAACRCRKTGNQPRGCGKHGINGANDYICYVQSPEEFGCSCSQESKRYRGVRWRYCGDTLGEMQVFLNVQDNKNGIQPTQSGNGYCGGLNSRDDI